MSLGQNYFTDLYERDADPWKFETSRYEHEKYSATLAALRSRRFVRGLEVGCSIGVLTLQLSLYCDNLIATDVSEIALGRARQRCAGLPVTFQRQMAPAEWPAGRFNLIVLSEMLYYFDMRDLKRMARRVLAAIAADGVVLLVHWLHPTEYPLNGDEAASGFVAACGMRLHVDQQWRTADYRIDVLSASG